MSRPADRIEPMIALLRSAWLSNPDWRLGQLLGNAARDPEAFNEFGVPSYRDPFNVEDDEMWSGLARIARGE